MVQPEVKKRVWRLKNIAIPVILCFTLSVLVACSDHVGAGKIAESGGSREPYSAFESTKNNNAVDHNASLPTTEGETVELRMAVDSVLYEGSYYDALIEGFEQQSNVAIIKVDYGEDESKLMLELAAGDSPDLIISFSNDGILTEKNALMDVYPYLDEDSDISRDDFTNLDMLGYGDQLTRVSPGYNINVTFGLTKTYGGIERSEWTVEKFLNTLENAKNPLELTANSTGENFLLNYTLSYAAEHVSYKDATCNYETDTFVALLNAAAQVDAAYAADAGGSGDTYSELFEESPELLDQTQIQGVAGYTILRQELVGCPVTFLGYPTGNGGKMQAMFVTPVSGCAGTTYPNEVWSFLKYVLTADSVCKDTTIFPVYTKALEQQISDAVANYEADTPRNTQMGFQEALGKMIDLESLETGFSQEGAELLKTLLYSDSMYNGYDGVITPIIQEETEALFSGDKTAEETAALIQNRVSIYLAEQK